MAQLQPRHHALRSDTRAVGVKVIEHWSSGDKAANNIINHAKWLDSAAAWAERLSVAAEAVAHAFDIAKQDTPTPDEFADAQSDVMKARALIAVSPALGMLEYQRATSRYADLYRTAEEAAERYPASVSDVLTGVGNLMVPCPPIASQADIPNIPITGASTSRFQTLLRSRSRATPNTPRTGSLDAMARLAFAEMRSRMPSIILSAM